MELKRILARDTRSANEQALARFGPNVFVISNQRLAGQTELVVAVDVQAAEPKDDETVPDSAHAVTGHSFQDQLVAAHMPKSQTTKSQLTAKSANPFISFDRPEPSLEAVAPSREPTGAENDRDLIRSREIVATVREEIAALRQEFRLSQKAMMWQAEQSWPQEIQPLVQGLSEAAVPASLRTLLLDALRDQTHLGLAIDTITEHLLANIDYQTVAAPSQGIHVLAGPSGSGKSSMASRLLRRAMLQHNPDQMTVIAYKDQRAGAWAQTQMLCAQLGVDCLRAKDADTLAVLLSELDQRQLILIDTAGVQLQENMQALRQVCPQAQWHAVLPADASSVTLQRVLSATGIQWSSLMLSKLDEASAPWPLLHYLLQAGSPVGLSVACGSEKIDEALQQLTPDLLAELAVAQWMPQAQPALSPRPAPIANLMEIH